MAASIVKCRACGRTKWQGDNCNNPRCPSRSKTVTPTKTQRSSSKMQPSIHSILYSVPRSFSFLSA